MDVEKDARRTPLRLAASQPAIPDNRSAKKPQAKSPELKLTISVKDSSGDAIHGAEVCLFEEQNSAEDENLSTYGSTDESGEFVTRTRIESAFLVVNGSRNLKARYGDFREALVFPSGLQEHRIEISLVDCDAVLSIKAVTESGEPVSNLDILAIEELGQRTKLTTDKSGELFLGELLPGRMWIQSTATSATLPKVLGTKSQKVVLKAGEKTHLRLTLQEDGQAEALLKFHGDSTDVKCNVRVTLHPKQTIRADSPSSLVLTESNPRNHVSAPVGDYAVYCHSLLPTSIASGPISVESQKTTQVTVHVYLVGGTLSGKVVGYDGKTVAGAYVYANFEDPLNRSLSQGLNTATDVQGEFALDLIPAKSAKLRVDFGYSIPGPKPQYAFFGDFDRSPQVVPVGSQNVVLKLERGYSIHVECSGIIKDGERISIDRYRFASFQDFNLEGMNKLKIHKHKYTLCRVSSDGKVLETKTVDLRALPVGTYSTNVRFE